MKKLSYILIFVFIVSCTSNTIFEKPKDLISKDSMSLLIQELMIASAAKYQKNFDLEVNVNYTPLVYEKFKIDSVRFKSSSFYYASKIDTYKEIIENAKNALEEQKTRYADLKTKLDSIRKDSIKKSEIPLSEFDTIDSNSDDF